MKIPEGFIVDWAHKFNAQSEKNFRRFPMKDTVRRMGCEGKFQFLIRSMLIDFAKKNETDSVSGSFKEGEMDLLVK